MPAGQPGAGRVHTISDGTNTVTLGYDADGHVVSRAYSDGTATSAAYTDTGLLATTTDVTGAVTTYGYDDRRPDDLGHPDPRRPRRWPSVTYTYDAMSRVADHHPRQRRHHDQHLDARNQLDTQRTTTASGAVIEEHAYTYDSHGNVATRTDTIPAASDRRHGRHLDHRLPLRRLQPAARLGHLPRRQRVGDAVDVDDLHPQHRRRRRRHHHRAARSTTNTIDAAGQLTAQTTDGTVVNQTFDGDGRVTQSLSGWR